MPQSSERTTEQVIADLADVLTSLSEGEKDFPKGWDRHQKLICALHEFAEMCIRKSIEPR